MISVDRVSGLILAGGQGRRMQRQGVPTIEKGLVLLHDRPLVAWAADAMPSTLSHRYVSANRHLDRYERFGTVVPDAPDLEPDSGPLAGVLSTLRQLRTPWLYVVPVDVPFPPPGVCQTLLQHVARSGDKLAYAHSTRPQPLFMLVHQSLQASLEAYLRDGSRKVQGWQQQHGDAVPIAKDEDGFLNVNTPEDMLRAHQRRTS